MTNGTNGWVFVSDEVYRAALTERDRARQVAAELRAENAILRQLVYWQWGGLVLACGVLAWIMWTGGGW